MKPAVITKEKILQTSVKLVHEKGWEAFNIRTVAAACSVSVGSIYNYFPVKSDLAIETIQCIFQEIFPLSLENPSFDDLPSCILWFYARLEYGETVYPGFFTSHSLLFMQEERSDGQKYMEQVFTNITCRLCVLIEREAVSHPSVFDASFTPEILACSLFSILLSSLVRHDFSPAAALALIHKLFS